MIDRHVAHIQAEGIAAAQRSLNPATVLKARPWKAPLQRAVQPAAVNDRWSAGFGLHLPPVSVGQAASFCTTVTGKAAGGAKSEPNFESLVVAVRGSVLGFKHARATTCAPAQWAAGATWQRDTRAVCPSYPPGAARVHPHSAGLASGKAGHETRMVGEEQFDGVPCGPSRRRAGPQGDVFGEEFGQRMIG